MLAAALASGACARNGSLHEQDAKAVSGLLERSRDEAKLEEPLRRYLDEHAVKDEFLPVVLILGRQLTAQERARVVSKVEATARVVRKREQRAQLIAELERLAAAEQRELVRYLGELERAGKARHVRPLWIANAIGVTVPREIMLKLTAFAEIRSIHLDTPRSPKAKVSPGISQVNADAVWTAEPTGYDGSGVVVAILDSGVDYRHVDLENRMWINEAEDVDQDGRLSSADNDGVDQDANGYTDDVLGWSFAEGGGNDPGEVAFDGHGTYVAGIVAGDGSQGRRTGVAPGARIMALRDVITTGLSTEQAVWEAMQYALENGADIVNYSSAWFDTWGPSYTVWRTSIENLTAGGVLFVTGPGNYSSAGPPNDVLTPGRVPSSLTVGATDRQDVIAPFSTRGPASWENVSPFFDYPWPPGLLKPDVSAPGVGVWSTLRGGGYATSHGTSLAAAHAAGVAALLLQKDPGLTPYEIKYLLRETAVDLFPPEGPDVIHGWGRIDALAAIEESISSGPYDLSMTPSGSASTTVDIWVDNDDDGSPDTPVAGRENHLYARVRNLGGQVVPDVRLRFYYGEAASAGIAGFDPDADGDPGDGTFTYAGQYIIPILGPKGSKQSTAHGLIHWSVPDPPGEHWCVAVEVIALSPPGGGQEDLSNNRAFRRFSEFAAPPSAAQ